MRLLRFAFSPFLLCALAQACGGEVVSVGALRASDGGTPQGSSSPSSDAGSPTTQKDAAPLPACGTTTGPETVYDLAANAVDHVSDFFGDDERLVIGTNRIANFVAGHLDVVPPPKSGSQILYDFSPNYVRRIGRAEDRVYAGMHSGGTGADAKLMMVAKDGVVESMDYPNLKPFATNAARADVFFVKTSTAPAQDQVMNWNPPSAPTQAMVLPTNLRISSLAVNETDFVVLAQDTSALVPSNLVLRKNPAAGGGPYRVVARFPGDRPTNIAVDETSAYVGVFENDVYAILKISLDADDASFTTADAMAAVAVAADDFARIVLDDEHIYLSHGAGATCGGTMTFCPADVKVVRVNKKDGPAAQNPVVPVKDFTGPPVDEPQFRGFNVDRCFLYWYDAQAKTMMRESKPATL